MVGSLFSLPLIARTNDPYWKSTIRSLDQFIALCSICLYQTFLAVALYRGDLSDPHDMRLNDMTSFWSVSKNKGHFSRSLGVAPLSKRETAWPD